VKPTIEHGFEYRKLHWADLPLPPALHDAVVVDGGEATLVPQPAKRRRRKRVAVAA